MPNEPTLDPSEQLRLYLSLREAGLDISGAPAWFGDVAALIDSFGGQYELRIITLVERLHQRLGGRLPSVEKVEAANDRTLDSLAARLGWAPRNPQPGEVRASLVEAVRRAHAELEEDV